MRARAQSLSPRVLVAVAIVGVLAYSATMWVLVVSPKRSDASATAAHLADAELRLVEARAASLHRGSGTPVADVFRLAKAMPASIDQPGLVLEIARLAKQSGVTLRSIAPSDQGVDAAGPTAIPVTVVVAGSFRQVAKFLRRTRALVTVRDGRVRARGRLLGVQSVLIRESVAEGFPKLDATVTLNAYVYDGPILPPDLPDAPTEELEPSGGSSALGRTH